MKAWAIKSTVGGIGRWFSGMEGKPGRPMINANGGYLFANGETAAKMHEALVKNFAEGNWELKEFSAVEE